MPYLSPGALAAVQRVAATSYTTTCVIATPGQPNPADNGATQIGGSSSAPISCTLAHTRYEIHRPDGTIFVSSAQVSVPADSDVPEQGSVTVNGETLKILDVVEQRIDGVLIKQVIHLGHEKV
jgi:hypothetical protein